MFERLGEIHELLNFIWGTVIELNEELREELKPRMFSTLKSKSETSKIQRKP